MHTGAHHASRPASGRDSRRPAARWRLSDIRVVLVLPYAVARVVLVLPYAVAEAALVLLCAVAGAAAVPTIAAAQEPPPVSPFSPPEPAGMPPGMAYYAVVMLERANPAPGDAAAPHRSGEDRRAVMQAHLAYMNVLHERGWLVGAGPIADQGSLRGLWILRGVSPDDTRRLAAADPTVKAGLIEPRVLGWWGPAGIGDAYAAWRRANPDAPDRMLTMPFGVLVKGPTPLPSSAPGSERLQAAHLDHIFSLIAQGAVVAAGPFDDGGDYRGVLVFAPDTLEGARVLGEADPLVKAGHLALRLWPWMVAEGVLPAAAKADGPK